MCVPHHVYGFHQVTQGAMATYLLYPATALVHVVPDHVDPRHACFIEPFACSLHAVELGDIQWNDVVVISGCGPLGADTYSSQFSGSNLIPSGATPSLR